eukprot:12013237-Alexandrium_andersonii.AAC.1
MPAATPEPAQSIPHEQVPALMQASPVARKEPGSVSKSRPWPPMVPPALQQLQAQLNPKQLQIQPPAQQAPTQPQ